MVGDVVYYLFGRKFMLLSLGVWVATCHKVAQNLGILAQWGGRQYQLQPLALTSGNQALDIYYKSVNDFY